MLGRVTTYRGFGGCDLCLCWKDDGQGAVTKAAVLASLGLVGLVGSQELFVCWFLLSLKVEVQKGCAPLDPGREVLAHQQGLGPVPPPSGWCLRNLGMGHLGT